MNVHISRIQEWLRLEVRLMHRDFASGRLLFALLILGVPLLQGHSSSGAAEGRDQTAQPHQFVAMRMGTLFRIFLHHPDKDFALKASLAAFDRVEELEEIFSDYRERSESNRLCITAVGTPQRVSPELFYLLETALGISRMTRGAFDVTLGPTVRLWREARKTKKVPDQAALEKARKQGGYENVVMDAAAQTVMLKISDMRLDFGAIAKGYAADEALELLRERGIARALVEAGGDLAIGAPPPGKPGWRVVIYDPEQTPAKDALVLILHDTGIATSGDSFQFLDAAGERYSHIIDPAEGRGVRLSASTTVIARDGMTADALATAFSILPAEESIRLAQSLEGVSAFMTRRTQAGLQRFVSKGFPKFSAPDKAKSPAAKRKRSG